MTIAHRFAAQYIRMSTDTQDLSPTIQKEAISAYAAARNIDVVASYEDEGRSGVHLKNRPALLRLLKEVLEKPGFSTVLVYDVSRWGRFQDTDAAAYYEYHCRLHGVEVIYVAELFGPEVNPITALLKSMKRAMAAEYSRDLAHKARAGQHQVVSRGFQIGPLPPLGFRRCSVSADGQRRVVLERGQRKLAATDRIEWVAGPLAEIELVRRMSELYARTRLSFTDIARLGQVEGWRDHQGRSMSARTIATLLGNEALIGNFVWGRQKCTRSMIESAPSRCNGCLPRLIDDGTWQAIQRRTALEVAKVQSDEQILERLQKALKRNPLLSSRDLRANGLPCRRTLCRRFKGWPECLRQLGANPDERKSAQVERARVGRAEIRGFGGAMAERLKEAGQPVVFDGTGNVLRFSEFSMRVRLLRPTAGEIGQAWRIRTERMSRRVDFDLLVRMEEAYRPKDYFVVPPADVVVRFPQWLTADFPVELKRFWYGSPAELMARIRTIGERSGKDSARKRSSRRVADRIPV